jgi:DNA repair protein RadD
MTSAAALPTAGCHRFPARRPARRNVGRRGGEFIPGELEAAADDETKIAAAGDEIVALGAKRQCWLVFCCGIDRATHVRDALRARDVAREAVFGETPQDERERIIAAFRSGELQCLVKSWC